MADDVAAADTQTYRTREAVAVFADPVALEAAVDALQSAGFDRAQLSVLGHERTARQPVSRHYESVAEIEDDGAAPRAGFVPDGSRAVGEATAVGIPFYVGGLAGIVAVAASGGTLAAAIGATILGGAVGAGLGVLLARAVGRHHARRIEEQLAQGGFVLWVGVLDAAREQRALEVLKQHGGRDVHTHEITRAWDAADRPLATTNVDPLLEHDPSA